MASRSTNVSTMANDLNDKYSVKNLLFSKPIPNYVIPVPTNGYKVYACIDCGDKYILESSYNFHINRKSVKISYLCRHCGKMQVFFNRCNFLAHIRSHSFKTATINVTDLKVDPLPLNFFNIGALQEATKNRQAKNKVLSKIVCIECKKDVTETGTEKDRVQHYMKVTDINTVHSCPVCLFNVPTECALKTHLRLHFKSPPYICPECGEHLSNKSISYPYYNHDCDGFKMMRATAREKCQIPGCYLVHPNEHKEHFKKNHSNAVYKCPFCYVGCLDKSLMNKHIIRSHPGLKPTSFPIFAQCGICKGKLVKHSELDGHIKFHLDSAAVAYPCWACGEIFADVNGLVEHHIKQHGGNETLKNAFDELWKCSSSAKTKRLYRVVKRCEKCKRSFRYKCKFDHIKQLPNLCPYHCTKDDDNAAVKKKIICHLCKESISQDWEEVKKHYAQHHTSYRCLDAKVTISKLDAKTFKFYEKKMLKPTKKLLKRKREAKIRNTKPENVVPEVLCVEDDVAPKERKGEFTCEKCGGDFESKKNLEKHLVLHRDPYMAYQCMECGSCFAVKPTLSKHLLLEHAISDVEEYINQKQCFNESALLKYQYASDATEPLKENQCKICRTQFTDASDLEKHFRVHGMAFLMKTKNNSP